MITKEQIIELYKKSEKFTKSDTFKECAAAFIADAKSTNPNYSELVIPSEVLYYMYGLGFGVGIRYIMDFFNFSNDDIEEVLDNILKNKKEK